MSRCHWAGVMRRTVPRAAHTPRAPASCSACPSRQRWPAHRHRRNGCPSSRRVPGSCRPRQNGPCSKASATSTGPRWDSADCSRTASSLPLDTRINRASAAFSLSSGNLPPVTASRLIVSGSTKTQRPVRVMPIPTTSKRSRSKALSTRLRSGRHAVLATGSAEDHRDPMPGTIDPTNARLALTHDPRP